MNEWIRIIVTYLTGLGPWGPLIFVALYIMAAVTMAPAFVLTFAAGAVFGLWRGVLLVYLGAMLGATTVYALAAPLAHSRMMQWIDRDARVAAVRRVVVDDGLWVMFLLRLSPVIPFVMLNYALALSGVRFTHFMAASIGMLPTIIMYVYYGKVAGDVAKLAVGVAPPRGPEYYVLLIAGLAATILATTLVTRAARKAMTA